MELVRNMLHTAMEKGNDVKEEVQNILALTLARAAAIVYGQVLSNEEMVSLVAVSYTHLDVYKRQRWYRPFY